VRPEDQALLDRWTAFLGKVEARLDEICREAEAGVKAIFAQHPDDWMPITNALTGLDHRVRQLTDRITQTWEEQVDPSLEGRGGKVFDRADDLRSDANLALEEKWTRAKVRWLADIARETQPRALKALEEPARCSGCGAPLVVSDRRRHCRVDCGSCGIVNQVGPPAPVRNYYGPGVQALAEEAAAPIRFEIERHRLAADRWRRARGWAPEPETSLDEWEALERRYWTTMAEEKAKLLDAPVDEAFIESRMVAFQKMHPRRRG